MFLLTLSWSVVRCVCPQIRRQEAIDKGQQQRRVYVEKTDMRSKKLARKAGEHSPPKPLHTAATSCPGVVRQLWLFMPALT
jgi:hypothetical protein